MSDQTLQQNARQRYKPFLSWSQMLELASSNGVTRTTIRSWKDAGLLQAAPMAGRNKWPREALLKLLFPANQTQP